MLAENDYQKICYRIDVIGIEKISNLKRCIVG